MRFLEALCRTQTGDPFLTINARAAAAQCLLFDRAGRSFLAGDLVSPCYSFELYSCHGQGSEGDDLTAP